MGGCAVAKGGSGVGAGLGKLVGAEAAGWWLGSRHRAAGWGSKRSGRCSSRCFGSHLFTGLGQILGKDLDLD